MRPTVRRGRYVDGRFVGQTPLDVKNLPPGDHRVRVVKDGFSKTDRIVNVAAGKAGTTAGAAHRAHRLRSAPEGQATGSGISSGGGGSKKWLWIGIAGGGVPRRDRAAPQRRD